MITRSATQKAGGIFFFDEFVTVVVNFLPNRKISDSKRDVTSGAPSSFTRGKAPSLR
jgi:hypothetical protein